MDTKLTIQQIHLALRDSGLWNKRTDIMIPNLSWGLLPYEADFVVLSKSGYLTEVEIKRSWEDFKADFKKKHDHNAEQVYYFYYCVPDSIVAKVKEFLIEKYHGKCPAILSYNEEGGLCVVSGFGTRYAACLSTNVKRRKLFLEEQLTVARLGQLRYWSLLEKTQGYEEH